MSLFYICIFFVQLFIHCSEAFVNCTLEGSNETISYDTHDCKCIQGQSCKDGILIPMWRPVDNLSLGDKLARAFIYFIALLYLFLGVSIISDRFMASIEMITAQEKDVKITKKSGEVIKMTVRVWNDTVSNLTLMALGSSAPEILLSIIEVCGNNFKSGELGPNTIVGSAAFNLFMIIAICVYVIPPGEVRRQQHLRVFFITAAWSIFAYVWLYLIIAVISPGVVEIWEGLLTFLFFPLTVILAWIADRRLLVYKYLTYKRTKRGVLTLKEGGDQVEMQPVIDGLGGGGPKVIEGHADEEVEAFEESRREYMEILRNLRKRHPNMDIPTLQQIAEYEMIKGAKKSRAFYRVQATRRLTGGGNIVKKKLDKELAKNIQDKKSEELKKQQLCRVFFDPSHYTVLENIGTLNAIVSREGGPPDLTVLVDYRTADGSAKGGSDYFAVQGTLTFSPQDHHLNIPIEIIDDDVFEEDEHFYIHLDNLRIKTKDGVIVSADALGDICIAQLEKPATATVMILDDDHAGVFQFAEKEFVVAESVGVVDVVVSRSSGARGKVMLPYKTIDGTATGEKDYEIKSGYVEFDNDEVEKTISIGIVNDEEYEKTETFFVELGEPIWVEKLSDQSKVIERFKRRQRRKLGLEDEKKHGLLSWLTRKDRDTSVTSGESDGLDHLEPAEDDHVADLGKPRLGDIKRCSVKIKESIEFKGLVDRMVKTANLSLVLGTSSWREQFTDAFVVSAGGDDDEEGGEEGEEKEEKLPSCDDYMMHYLSFPFKLMCALCPPTEYWNGWACFLVSILMIGLFTAVIGDLANHFGCSIGLKDAVTAISFVAMGTSVPDTFASKVAAVQDKYADSSIGNVTGSNAVNVFLGIGIAWTICSIVSAFRGEAGFVVDAGTLGFSVTIFCVEAVVAIGIILLRRSRCVGGELGGPTISKVPTSLFFVLLWGIYLTLSSLESYCIIKGF